MLFYKASYTQKVNGQAFNECVRNAGLFTSEVIYGKSLAS
jgi:hypothetical protein